MRKWRTLGLHLGNKMKSPSMIKRCLFPKSKKKKKNISLKNTPEAVHREEHGHEQEEERTTKGEDNPKDHAAI